MGEQYPDSLPAGGDAQPFARLVEVAVDGLGSDIQLAGNFLGGERLGDQLQALALTRRKPVDQFYTQGGAPPPCQS